MILYYWAMGWPHPYTRHPILPPKGIVKALFPKHTGETEKGIRTEELKETANKMKSGKAPGRDGIL